MSKKYQVFVSSTYTDLVEERKEVIQAILECNCIPTGMELFSASNKRPWDVIKKVIDDCDYYLLIVADRYGSMTKDGKGNKISFTEMEYTYAKKKRKPIIAFLRSNITTRKNSKLIGDKKKLYKFREKLTEKMYAIWKDKGDLHKCVLTSLPELIRRSPSKGWIQGDKAGKFGELLVSSEKTGIIAIHPHHHASSILNDKLSELIKRKSKTVKTVKIIAYYGDGFLGNNIQLIKDGINAGLEFQLLIARKNKQQKKTVFLREVWNLEKKINNKPNNLSVTNRRKVALHTIEEMELYQKPKKNSFVCHMYNTQARYALILINDEWAWWTPYHSGIEVENTYSFEVVNNGESSIIKQCIVHFDALWKSTSKRSPND